jgi:nucleoside-diphosphate-sugar epimerase
VVLRLSNVHVEQDYQHVPGYWPDPHLRKWNLWGYIDARDAAAACRLALAARVTGARSFVIAAADTIMDRPSAELLAEVLSGVNLTREIGTYETLLSIDRAREVLGLAPGTPGGTSSPADGRPAPRPGPGPHDVAGRRGAERFPAVRRAT